MIVFVASGAGSGHASRANAIGRLLGSECALVIPPSPQDPIDWVTIPTFHVERDQIADAVNAMTPSVIVADYGCQTPELRDLKPDVWLWRLGRDSPTTGHTVDLEGPGACWPILGLPDEQILTREAARAELGVDPDRPFPIVVPSRWDPGFIERCAPHGTFVLDHFPVLRLLRAADHVTGPAAFDLWSEVNYLGIPANWVALSPRLAPDHILRVGTKPPTVVPGATAKLAATLDHFAESGEWSPQW